MLPAPAHPEEILLIRLKSIGDIVFTLPAVRAVRDNFPGARLHFMVSQEHAPLVAGFPGVDVIVPLDRRRVRGGEWAAAQAGFELLRRLRATGFARVIDFQGYGETEWLTWWSGAPEGWGHKYNRLRGWLYTRSLAHDRTLHPVARNLALLRMGGLSTAGARNEFVLTAGARAEARAFFTAQGLAEGRATLFIQPFTSAAHKNWPLEHFLALARHWRGRGVQVIFGGGPKERAALEPAVAAGFPVAAGNPLLVSAGLMELSTVVAGSDTGLLHLAVALGRRVVMLMHARLPGGTHPYQHPDWAVPPATGSQMADLKYGEVRAAVERAMAETGGAKKNG
jgi:ADP-heptose:LPS heptosyltransferase